MFLNRVNHLLVTLILTVVWGILTTSNYLYISFDLATTQDGNAQIYYDKGLGFNESDSIQIPIKKSNELNRYSIKIGSGYYSSLRLDPTNQRNSQIVLSNISVTSPAGLLVKRFNETQLSSNFANILSKGNIISSDVGADPWLILPVKQTLKQSFLTSVVRLTTIFLVIYSAISILSRVNSIEFYTHLKNNSLVVAIITIAYCYFIFDGYLEFLSMGPTPFDLASKFFFVDGFNVPFSFFSGETFKFDFGYRYYFSMIPILFRSILNFLCNGKFESFTTFIFIGLTFFYFIGFHNLIKKLVIFTTNESKNLNYNSLYIFLAFCPGILFLISGKYIYHEVFLWGIVFAIFSLLFFIDLEKRSDLKSLFLGELFLVLTILSRPTLAMPIVAYLGFSLGLNKLKFVSFRVNFKQASLFMIAMLFPIFFMLLINYLKFNNPLESGGGGYSSMLSHSGYTPERLLIFGKDSNEFVGNILETLKFFFSTIFNVGHNFPWIYVDSDLIVPNQIDIIEPYLPLQWTFIASIILCATNFKAVIRSQSLITSSFLLASLLSLLLLVILGVGLTNRYSYELLVSMTIFTFVSNINLFTTDEI